MLARLLFAMTLLASGPALAQSLPSPAVATPVGPTQAVPKGYVDSAITLLAPKVSPLFTGNITLGGAATPNLPNLQMDVPNGSSAPLMRLNHQGLGGSPSNAAYDGLNYPYGFVFNQTRIAADQLSANADMGNRSGAIGEAVVHLFGGGPATGTRIAQAAFATMQAPMAASDSPGSFFGAHWGFASAYVNDNGTAAVPKGNLFGYNPQVQLKKGATYWGTIQGMEDDVEVQTGASVAYKYGLNITTIGADAVHASVREAALHIGAVPSSHGWAMGIQFSDYSASGVPVSSTGTLIGSLGKVGTVAKGVDFTGFAFTGTAFASPGFSISATGAGAFAGNISLGDDAANGSISIQGTSGTPTPYLDIGPRRLIADVAGRLNLLGGTLAIDGQTVWNAGNFNPARYAPLTSPQFTGIVSVGSAGLLADDNLRMQLNATTAATFYAVNKNGAYGMLFGYDPTRPAGVIRNVTTDKLVFIVNNTTDALVLSSDGSAAFPGNVAIAGAAVKLTALPTAAGSLPSGTIWRNGTVLSIVP